MLLAGGLFATAAAQSDTVRKTSPADTTPSVQPATADEAIAAGAKLLGVFDAATGQWIGGASVRDTLGNQTVTSPIGVAALNGLSPVLGNYMLEIRKTGYSPQLIKLAADTASEFLVSLMPNPLGTATRLPAMSISAARENIWHDKGQRAGFFVRCSTGLVECVGRHDLDLRPTDHLPDLLSEKPGISRICTSSSRLSFNSALPQRLDTCLAEMQSPFGYCVPTYFLNGFPWAALAGVAQVDLDNFFVPKNVQGIEVYLPGSPRPPRFDEPLSDCGAVVIWTQ